MPRTIVLDLDDTLIDTKQRQYRVIKSFFAHRNLSIGSFDDYLTYRKERLATNSEFSGRFLLDSYSRESYRKHFAENIESEAFLKYDTLIASQYLLSAISGNANLVLLSLRSSRRQGMKQLSDLGIFPLFSEVFFVRHGEENPKTAVLKELKDRHGDIVFVGDTGTDWRAARDSGVDFVGVETGLFPLLQETGEKVENINVYLENLLKKTDE